MLQISTIKKAGEYPNLDLFSACLNHQNLSGASHQATFFPSTRSKGTVSMAMTATSQPFLANDDATSMPIKEPPITWKILRSACRVCGKACLWIKIRLRIWKPLNSDQFGSMSEVLLMEEILHQLIGSLSHYLQGFLHPGFLPSTVCLIFYSLPVFSRNLYHNCRGEMLYLKRREGLPMG